jgi:peptidoglycan/xylan/chitin deacetylase (PgdA/CDA1 family)
MGDGPAVQVPPPRSRAYYLSKHVAHRLQAALAWRAAGGYAGWRTGARIAAYHRVTVARDELAVAPARFRRQMESLVASGARPVSLADAAAALAGGSRERLACVTFDDAYHDNLENALPVLLELGIPATIFVATGITDGTTRLYWYGRHEEPQLLSWDEVATIADNPLFTIGAHSRTHPALPALDEETAWEEIAGSKAILERRLGRPVMLFAYPAGLYGERETRMVREAGYAAAVTTEPGLNTPDRPRECLYRMLMDRLDTVRMFEAKLAGCLDRPWGADNLPFRRERTAPPGRRLRSEARRGWR